MRTDPTVFWTTFAALFVASMFIPITEFRKPGSESGSTIYVATVDAYAVLSVYDGASWLGCAFALTVLVFHIGVIACLAMLLTGAYRIATGQAFESTHVFSSPEPTRAEPAAILGGNDRN